MLSPPWRRCRAKSRDPLQLYPSAIQALKVTAIYPQIFNGALLSPQSILLRNYDIMIIE